MAKLTITSAELTDLTRSLVDARSYASVYALRSATRAAEYVTGEIRAAIFESVNQSPRPGNVRTGNLARSFKPEIEVAPSGRIEARSVSTLSYAAIQNDGGTVKAKRKWLSIPLVSLAAGRWPRTFRRGALTHIVSKKGNHLLVDTGALKKGRIKPVFLLRESVKIPGMNYLDKAYKTGLAQIVGIFNHGTGLVVDRIVY